MIKNKNAFTMIELVFVIVVLGILASIAIPRFAVTRDDALIAKAKSDIASIRSAIITERQARLFRGDNSFISDLDNGAGTGSGETLFDSNGSGVLLAYGITSETGNGGWMKKAANVYTYTVKGITTDFTYDDDTGMFDCTVSSSNKCADLTR